MFVVHIPGLRENGLRIERGDVVQLRQLVVDPARFTVLNSVLLQGGQPTFQHDAIIWNIDRLREELLLRVDGLVPWSMQFNVSFTLQKERLDALYRALVGTHMALLDSSDSWLRRMLFPTCDDGSLQHTLNKRQVQRTSFDQVLNYEQLRAIDTVSGEDYGTVPYLISGPPGTGKTKTLVELALQLLRKQEGSRLLMCAPPESAADTLIQRLGKHLKPTQLLRLTAPSRSFPEVPDAVLPFCYIEHDMFTLPPFAVLMKSKIVVTTCRDAEIMLRARVTNADLHHLEQGVLSSIHPEQALSYPRLHWTGLLLDEAAQATETEALIPLAVVAPPQGFDSTGLAAPVFVMAGDQHQLGPRTASKTATMKTSLFERLLDRPLYREHPLARSKQTGGVMRRLTQDMLPVVRPPFANLIRNYRSHPAVLATPSAQFYHDTLEPEAIDTDSLLSWQGWKGRQWPVLFSCNTGKDEIEQDGGGWYNNDEARMALQYAQWFIDADLIEPQDICIMSPFSAQVKLLRHLARTSSRPQFQLNIGPLEAFQGLESRLVILCTTRTRERFLEQDLARGFGVIHEPKRYNVALTRAKQGLIVIGNPVVLQQDENWRGFLSFCYRNGLWDGDDDKPQGAGYTFDLGTGPTSRLEKQMRFQEDQAEDVTDHLINGVRHLGIRPGSTLR